MRALPVLAVLLASLAGCSGGDQTGPGGVTTAESQALDDAAEMIEQRRLPPDALRTPAPSQAPATTAPAK